ncbi:MAG TPA: phospholipase D family protein [Steroidobacteraceae bacterium]|nr:phospholipase D family protein [Steroidobacteraceae bacterium]
MRKSRFGRLPLWAVAMLCLAAAGCASLPRHVHKERSEAIHDVGSTTLGRLVAEAERRNLSGIRLLASGDEALASLIALADHAERTLDIQYYIITQDESARILLQHVREAAERGVRVRILVDDFNTAGQDRRFMHLGQNAHIEVRVFNPFPGGRSATWTRLLASFSELPRINHRMHNKLFVADNALAITGGRNIGDQYFTRDKGSNFIDLDVVAAGNIVPQLSASFDAFWNSKYAYPIASVAAPVPLEAEPTWPKEPVADNAAASAAVGDAAADAAAAGAANFLAREIDAGELQLAWVPATVLADRPAKIASESSPDQEETIANDLSALIRTANQELVIISPYFVPGTDGIALLRSLVRRGVHIRILTNSLAATDSPLVHIGYSHYRVELLHLGVELSEMRPKLGTARPRLHPFRSGYVSLHAKAVVIDEKTVFIGSLNMDARSARINSELGLVIRSSEIARQVTNLLDDISTDGSYKLQLVGHDHIEWSSGEPGAMKTWHKDPDTTFPQRLWLKVLTPFAPDEFL